MNFPLPCLPRLRSGYALPTPRQTRQSVMNPAGTHLSFAETCSDERGQLFERSEKSREPSDTPSLPGRRVTATHFDSPHGFAWLDDFSDQLLLDLSSREWLGLTFTAH
jgi:hypothetical protein